MAKKPPNKTTRTPTGRRKATKPRATDNKSTKGEESQNGTETRPAIIGGEHDAFVTLKKKVAMLKALKFHYGIIAPAAEAVGISRRTHYRWLESDSGYKEEVEAIIEATFDFVESKMVQRINEGSDTMLIWYSKTKMKNRGFVERTEVEVSEKASFVVAEGQKGINKTMDVIHKKTGTNDKS